MTACHYPCGRDCQLIGVSGPDTLSYGLARRGRHDRETVGHESAGTSRPRPIASATAPVGTSRSVAVRPSARPTTPEGVTSGRSVPAGSPRRLNPPAIGEGESEQCRAPPTNASRMPLGICVYRKVREAAFCAQSRCEGHPMPVTFVGSSGPGDRGQSVTGSSGMSKVEGFGDDVRDIAVNQLLLPRATHPNGGNRGQGH
jgi:hypothetical protein